MSPNSLENLQNLQNLRDRHANAFVNKSAITDKRADNEHQKRTAPSELSLMDWKTGKVVAPDFVDLKFISLQLLRNFGQSRSLWHTSLQ